MTYYTIQPTHEHRHGHHYFEEPDLITALTRGLALSRVIDTTVSIGLRSPQWDGSIRHYYITHFNNGVEAREFLADAPKGGGALDE